MKLLLLVLLALCSAQDPSSCSSSPILPACSGLNCPDNAYTTYWYDLAFDCAPSIYVPALNDVVQAVWVSWTAPATSNYVVSTVSTRTTFDAQLSLYDTCPVCSGNPISCTSNSLDVADDTTPTANGALSGVRPDAWLPTAACALSNGNSGVWLCPQLEFSASSGTTYHFLVAYRGDFPAGEANSKPPGSNSSVSLWIERFTSSTDLVSGNDWSEPSGNQAYACPTGLLCGEAIPISTDTGGIKANYQCGGTVTGGTDCQTSAQLGNVWWFAWTPQSSTATYYISTYHPDTIFDTYLSVFRDCAFNLAVNTGSDQSCDDDPPLSYAGAGSTCGSDGATSNECASYVFANPPIQTYYIMVTAFDAADAPRPNSSEFVIYVDSHGPNGYPTPDIVLTQECDVVTETSDDGSNTGAIIGGVVAGVVVLIIIIVVVVVVCKKKGGSKPGKGVAVVQADVADSDSSSERDIPMGTVNDGDIL